MAPDTMLILFSHVCLPVVHERECLKQPLVKKLDSPFPGQASGPGVILRTILLEEPVARSWIGKKRDAPAGGAQDLPEPADLLARLKIVMLGKMALNIGLCSDPGGRRGAVEGDDCPQRVF